MKTDKKLLVDTNVILYLLNGNEDVREVLKGYEIFISVITELEILRFPSLTESEFTSIAQGLKELKIVKINPQIKDQVFKLSRQRRIKLSAA